MNAPKTEGQTAEALASTVLQVSRATAVMLIIAYVVYVWFMGHTVSRWTFSILTHWQGHSTDPPWLIASWYLRSCVRV